ncbi:hypothetical protein LTR95_018915, partial [Oleoguttula sp. CCFEE 5521]
PPAYWGFMDVPVPPKPSALIGLNGLYDLPALVYGLGESHQQLSGVYNDLQSIAFGQDQSAWLDASPARFSARDIQARLGDGKGSVPSIIMLDQSPDDQLVPMDQMVRMRALLEGCDDLQVLTGKRCVGTHAAPWEGGAIIWESVMDVLPLLE